MSSDRISKNNNYRFSYGVDKSELEASFAKNEKEKKRKIKKERKSNKPSRTSRIKQKFGTIGKSDSRTLRGRLRKPDMDSSNIRNIKNDNNIHKVSSSALDSPSGTKKSDKKAGNSIFNHNTTFGSLKLNRKHRTNIQDFQFSDIINSNNCNNNKNDKFLTDLDFYNLGNKTTDELTLKIIQTPLRSAKDQECVSLVGFDAEKHLPEKMDRMVCLYALTKIQVEQQDTSGETFGTTFLRSNSFDSRIKTHQFKDAGAKAAQDISEAVSKNMGGGSRVIATSSQAYGIGGENTDQPKLSKFTAISSAKEKALAKARGKIFQNSLDAVEKALAAAFGNPDDPQSVRKAAARFSSEDCTAFAIIMMAIKTSGLDDDREKSLTVAAATDTFILRSISSALMQLASNSNKPEEKESLLQLAKVLQSLFNARGIGAKDSYAPWQNVNDDLKARADKAIEAFTAVIVERADRQDVSAVKKTGDRVLQEAKAGLAEEEKSKEAAEKS